MFNFLMIVLPRKQFFEKNITGQGGQLIILNLFLDSLCNFVFENIGLTPGIPKGCFQHSQDAVHLVNAICEHPLDDTYTITLMHNHKFQYKTNPTVYHPWHIGSGSVPLLPRHLAVAAVAMRLQLCGASTCSSVTRDDGSTERTTVISKTDKTTVNTKSYTS